jgi:hypothetical protein
MLKKVKYQFLAFILGAICFYCFISSHNFISDLAVNTGISPYLLKMICSLSVSQELKNIIAVTATILFDFILFVSISIFLLYIFANKLYDNLLLNGLLMTVGSFIIDKMYFSIMHTQTFDFTYFQVFMLWSVNKIASILIMASIITLYFLIAIILSKKIRSTILIKLGKHGNIGDGCTSSTIRRGNNGDSFI